MTRHGLTVLRALDQHGPLSSQGVAYFATPRVPRPETEITALADEGLTEPTGQIDASLRAIYRLTAKGRDVARAQVSS